MHKIHNRFILILTIMTVSASLYVYFSQDLNSASAASGLTSSSGTNPASTTQNSKAELDVSFIDKLASLTSIDIDTTLFANNSFNTLRDNTVVLEPVQSGRQNPFAPIVTEASSNAVVSPVVTNPPMQITDKTAIFNGSIRNGLTGVTSSYFEYGTTPDMGKITPGGELSLLGTFIKKVVNLTPKTNYYFRAVVKVGSVSMYGDVVTFTTN